MKQAQLIYNTNRQTINFMLIDHGYPPTFDGLLDAIEDFGDAFLVKLYNEITIGFSEAEGDFWPKFKNIFHKAINIGQGVDSLINRDKQTNNNDKSVQISEEEEKKKNNKKLMFWGIGAAAIIIILVIIYAVKK